MKVDVHVHLAGVGTGGSGCWTSPDFLNRPVLRMLRRLYRISESQMRTSADQDWAALIADHVRASELDAAVALGFDGVYDRSGELDRRRSQMIVPPSWVLEACRRHPGVLLPGPSVNPMRRDALERLDESIEGGAVLIKWLPAAQGIDPSDRSHRKFYDRLAASGVALLVHSGGGELTFAEVDPRLKDLALLEAPLRAGVIVVCAHSGVPVHLSRDADQTPLLRSLLERYPNLWLDNSGMANPSRFAHLARFARDHAIRARTLYGSDYPVPCIPIQYLHRLGPARAWRLQRERNPFDRDVRLKRALGYPDDTLTRAAGVLPRLRIRLR
jgi:predicted TIM-barrel fold metal-dependent hydrolase